MCVGDILLKICKGGADGDISVNDRISLGSCQKKTPCQSKGQGVGLGEESHADERRPPLYAVVFLVCVCDHLFYGHVLPTVILPP